MQKETVQENNQRSEIAKRRVRLTVQEGRLAPRNKEENRARKEQNAKARKEREAMKAGRRSGKKIWEKEERGWQKTNQRCKGLEEGEVTSQLGARWREALGGRRSHCLCSEESPRSRCPRQRRPHGKPTLGDPQGPLCWGNIQEKTLLTLLQLVHIVHFNTFKTFAT